MKAGNYHRNEVFAKYVDFPKDRECVSPSHFQLFFEESLWEGENEEGLVFVWCVIDLVLFPTLFLYCEIL